METEIYTSGNIRVTNSRFIVDGDTYAVNGITSVKAREKKKSFLAVFIAAIVVFFYMINCFSNGTISVGFLSLLIFAGLVYWISVLKRPEYTVVVTSASGEAEAYTSKDRKRVGAIVEAINQAIIGRG